MPVTGPSSSPFGAFWMGGFEGADHVNIAGARLDLAAASGHLDRLDEDHRRAAQAGLGCVRESIGWRLAEGHGGAIDLSRAVRVAQSAERHGLQVLWTLMHYGLPDDLCLHDDAMIGRFERFAAEVARVIGPLSRRAPVYTPVNEIGFLAWGASLPAMFHAPNNRAGADAESSRVSGYTVKRRLAHAAIRATLAMRRIDPRARFLHIEPVVHVVAPRDRPDLAQTADQVQGWQWQAWDLIAGRLEPQLGGSDAALDLVGVNHYHTSQWEFGTEQRLNWHGREPRRKPLGALLDEAWQRYRRPLLVAETSHVGAGRAAWLNDIAAEVRRARGRGVPVHGICLYPVVDRPDWADPQRWHRSGLFHVPGTPQAVAGAPAAAPAGGCVAATPASTRAAKSHQPPQPLSRFPESVYLATLRAWQAELATPQPDPAGGETGCGASAGRRPPPRQPAAADGAAVILAFSHLRWDFVRHRARHLLSRLAEHRRVVFVEEPLHADGPPRLDRITQGPRTEVLVPYTSLPDGGFGGAQQPLLQALLQDWLSADGIADATAWLCTPMAWPLVRTLPLRHVVYDCSDELAGFRGASAALPRLEADLLAAADIVFAAGPSLAAARAGSAGDRLQLLPNGVDAAHFAPRRQAAAGWDAEEAARLQAGVPNDLPRLGFAGVVDERFDLALLATLADLRAQWQFVIAGPVVKIDTAGLPRRPNIHWLGDVPWRVLPRLMSSWQVGLLPFALNAATVHANPLKVLEYLAAELPVVATPLADLPLVGEGCVAVAHSAVAFARACEAALAETLPLRAARRRAARRWAGCHGWDAVAAVALQRLTAVHATTVPAARDKPVADVAAPETGRLARRAPAVNQSSSGVRLDPTAWSLAEAAVQSPNDAASVAVTPDADPAEPIAVAPADKL